MKPIVAIVAPGAMGAAIANRLAEHGVDVVTVLTGRGARSVARAKAASMRAVEGAALTETGFLLSIVPPVQALNVATRLAPLLGDQTIFVDCNAISGSTARQIGEVVAKSGRRFIDASIIGMPPKPSSKGPVFYASGPEALALAQLRQYGIEVRVMDAPIGAASDLKMSYGGIIKGLIGLAAAMMLAATRAGCASALREQLAESQPHLLELIALHIPDMYPKAYRWVAEMEEIGDFAKPDQAAGQIYQGLAALFQRLADDADHDTKAEIIQLSEFLEPLNASAGAA